MIFNNLDVEAYDREYEDRELVRRVAAYAAPHRARLVIIALSVLLISGLSAGVPLLLAAGVGRFDTPGATFPAMLVAGVFVAWILIWLGNYLRRRLTTRAIGDMVLSLRRDSFSATMRHDLAFHDRYAAGRIVSRITSDTQDFGQSVALVAELIGQVIEVVILAVVLLRISPRLTLIVLVWGPVVIAAAAGFRILARYVTRQGARAQADVNAKILETVGGIAVAKNFRRESTVYDEFLDVNATAYAINVRRGFALATVFPALNLLMGFGTGSVVYFGALSTIDAGITVAAWFLFLQSLERFWFPLMNLSAFWSQVQVGFAAIERVFALIDHESSVVQTGSESVERINGDIRFESVRFGYGDGTQVLPEFSLHVKPGESVALVGHTGAGKSSIARLVARFYEFQGGEILIDGRDIRSLDLGAYRRRLGVVPQTPFLFSGSVADNIRYARRDASDAEIMALAQTVGDGEWLAALPEGLATDVGERGSSLSMGQRQLVALLRVLLQKPAIFVLDEATASIDPFTEAQIQEALLLILKDSTALVIAHRLSTVRAADRIVVLDGGRIIEEGDHMALMSAGGHYRELYDTYFRHQALDYRPKPKPEPVQEPA